MISFGKTMVNLRKDIDPIIETMVILKTEHFVNRMGAWLYNPICGNIFKRAYNKDPFSPDFNIKKFLQFFML
jgi:hypothetical protein